MSNSPLDPSDYEAIESAVMETARGRWFLAEYARRTPAGPTLTTEDVAGAVFLLCQPEAAMITGHTLVVDGGYCISG